MNRSFLIRVELAGHKEEVVTDAMEQDRDVEHPQPSIRIAIRQQEVAERPGKQPRDQNVLDSKTAEDERHEQHHHNFGGLSKRHFACSILDVQLIEVGIGKREIESKRNASQD